MPSRLIPPKGPTTNNDDYRGRAAEITVNTTTNAIRVHDGTNAGGVELARSDMRNVVNPDFGFSGQGALVLPSGTTAQRPSSTTEGAIRYNRTTRRHEVATNTLGTFVNLLREGDIADQSLGTGSLAIPVGTTAQRPTSRTAGSMRQNSTTNRAEQWTGTSWANVLRDGDTFTAPTATLATRALNADNAIVANRALTADTATSAGTASSATRALGTPALTFPTGGGNNGEIMIVAGNTLSLVNPANLASIRGPQGIQGIPGAAGRDGTNGAQGLRGLPGAAGRDGSNGAQGLRGLPGANGSPGAAGRDGTNGTNGTDGVSLTSDLAYRWNATGPQVNSGYITVNNISIQSVTEITIHNTDRLGANRVEEIVSWARSTSRRKGTLRVYADSINESGNANRFATFSITAVHRGTTRTILTVEAASNTHGQVTPFVIGSNIRLSFSETGDSGASSAVITDNGAAYSQQVGNVIYKGGTLTLRIGTSPPPSILVAAAFTMPFPSKLFTVGMVADVRGDIRVSTSSLTRASFAVFFHEPPSAGSTIHFFWTAVGR